MPEKQAKKNKKPKRSVLIIDSSKNKKTKYSSQNLPGAKMINLENINIVDLLKYRYLLITKANLEKLEKTYKAV